MVGKAEHKLLSSPFKKILCGGDNPLKRIYIYIYIYMGASLLFTTPIDAPGRHHGKKVTPPWPPGRDTPGKFPKEFPASGREFLGPKLFRPPAGRKNAPAFGRGRLVVSEYAGKIDFCKGK